MYILTLTRDERRAFTWVSYRYPTGDEWQKILFLDCWPEDNPEYLEWCDNNPELGPWDEYPNPITFKIPEHKAWELNELACNQNGIEYATFPCFSDELATKLTLFCERIV